ncbi:SOS response-associated peptidase [Gelidibacter gilvus]|uniref:Abasic site processing protein n=1 Tax=Gelidibacter gilvus TaxID=59602 RepID=A0A4Q0XE64_9FLAO|nr:SOS response-associated peptidase [Gelidibacter gilvus]RXJ49408.1 SOS response-associated peptidase [Gelidibacter gilvus]
MCYDIKTSVEAQLKRAERKGDRNAVNEIMERLVPLTDLPLYHAMGFDHPSLLIYTDRSPDFPEVATWGLIPHWVRDEAQMKKTWNTTLNARGETIFEKNSFRTAAKKSRCLIYVDGFYEHHHFNKETYPFFIYRKDKEPMIFAGLYSEWHHPETGGTMTTFSIVTTKGNSIMSKIHNNPKLDGPRMPVILPDQLADKWLMDYQDDLDKQSIEDLIREYPDEELSAYTVNTLRGKNSVGNSEEASKFFKYTELPELQIR